MTDPTPAPAGDPAAAAAAPAGTPAPAVTTVAGALLAGDPAAPAAAPAAEGAPAAVDPAAAGEGAAESIALPGKDATPEQWAEFYAKVGRPESPDGYEMEVPDGDDGAFAKQVAPLLHKAGITGEQAKVLSQGWNQMKVEAEAAIAEADRAEIARMDTQNKAEAAALKNEWGANHDANMHFAKLATQQFFPAEQAGAAISALESVLGYRKTIEFLHGIGKGLGEHDAAGLGGAGSGAGPKTAAERLYGASS